MIDLRSDTATRPTSGMRAAIASAEVGDEQRGEDPSVTELQERVAALLGHEAALFLPTATMANQIALKLHARPGDVLVAHEHAHVLVYEYGGAAVHAGLITVGVPSESGRFGGDELERVASPTGKAADQRVTLVSVENTSNAAGGRCWPLAELDDLVARARALDVRVHLDGARVLNAAVSQRVDPAEIGRRADTATLCLSKGLGCPLGALLAGSVEAMQRAWREKHLFGGAMRQAGIVAAAGLYALEHNVERLADDHARARALAETLAEAFPGSVDPAAIETNIVCARADALPDEVLAHLAAHEVLAGTIDPATVRFVLHADVDDDGLARAQQALTAIARP